MIETYTVKSLILLVISGVLAGNFALEKLMGAAPVFGLSRKENNLTALGVGVLVVTIHISIIVIVIVVVMLFKYYIVIKDKNIFLCICIYLLVM